MAVMIGLLPSRLLLERASWPLEGNGSSAASQLAVIKLPHKFATGKQHLSPMRRQDPKASHLSR